MQTMSSLFYQHVRILSSQFRSQRTQNIQFSGFSLGADRIQTSTYNFLRNVANGEQQRVAFLLGGLFKPKQFPGFEQQTIDGLPSPANPRFLQTFFQVVLVQIKMEDQITQHSTAQHSLIWLRYIIGRCIGRTSQTLQQSLRCQFQLEQVILSTLLHSLAYQWEIIVTT